MKFSFKLKISVSMIAVTFITVGIVLLTSYIWVGNILFTQMQNRLLDVAKTGTYLITQEDRNAIKKIKNWIIKHPKRIKPTTPSVQEGFKENEGTFYSLDFDTALNYMNKNANIQALIQKLRQIKSSSKKQLFPIQYINQTLLNSGTPNIKFVYLWLNLEEIPDNSTSMWLIDADYEDVPIGTLYQLDVKQIPIFQTSLQGKPAVGTEFIHEVYEKKDFYTLSSMVPILDTQGNVLATLGVDYNVTSEANILSTIRIFFVLMFIISIVIVLITALLLSRTLVNPINLLTSAAEKLKNKDFTVKVQVKNKDELGVLADTFNSMTTTIDEYATQMEELNKVYFNFVPKNFLDQLGLKSITDIKLGDQVEKKMTVLFSDIRSFTTISEGLDPSDTFNFINSYLSYIGPVIRKYDGFIDKYIGDAIMALFPNSPYNALKASIEMRNMLFEFNKKREEEGKPPINNGIGINTGYLMLGTIGEKERMETTVIADAVNLAARIESLTKKLHSPILISEFTLNALSEDERKEFFYRFVARLNVKGKSQPTSFYQILNPHEYNIELMVSYKQKFEEAIHLIAKSKFEEARESLKKIVEQNPKDDVAQFFLDKTDTLSQVKV